MHVQLQMDTNNLVEFKLIRMTLLFTLICQNRMILQIDTNNLVEFTFIYIFYLLLIYYSRVLVRVLCEKTVTTRKSFCMPTKVGPFGKGVILNLVGGRTISPSVSAF